MKPLAHYLTAACILPYSCLHTTMQTLVHYHAAACTIPYSYLHTTMPPLAHYYTATCTLPCSRLHTARQPLSLYHAVACTLPYICLDTFMQPFAVCTLSGSPGPKPLVSKSKPRGLGMTLNSFYPPPHHPITFRGSGDGFRWFRLVLHVQVEHYQKKSQDQKKKFKIHRLVDYESGGFILSIDR